MALEIIFRSNGVWGPGIGRKLFAPEHDLNFYNIKVAVEALQNDRPQPDNFASVGVRDLNMVVTLVSGREFVFPIPILQFNWRGAFAPFTIYQALDAFMLAGVGLFSVLIDHTSGATFDKDLTIGDPPLPAYNMLFGADAGAAAGVVINDMGFSYQGLIADSPDDVLWEMPCVRAITIPIAGNQHRAYLHEAPSTAIQVFPITQNETQVGTITFAIGANDGIFNIISDIELVISNRFGIRKPALDDATAAQLSVLFAGVRML